MCRGGSKQCFDLNKIMEVQLSLLSYLLHMTAIENEMVRSTRSTKLISNYNKVIFINGDEGEQRRKKDLNRPNQVSSVSLILYVGWGSGQLISEPKKAQTH